MDSYKSTQSKQGMQNDDRGGKTRHKEPETIQCDLEETTVCLVSSANEGQAGNLGASFSLHDSMNDNRNHCP